MSMKLDKNHTGAYVLLFSSSIFMHFCFAFVLFLPLLWYFVSFAHSRSQFCLIFISFASSFTFFWLFAIAFHLSTRFCLLFLLCIQFFVSFLLSTLLTKKERDFFLYPILTARQLTVNNLFANFSFHLVKERARATEKPVVLIYFGARNCTFHMDCFVSQPCALDIHFSLSASFFFHLIHSSAHTYTH